MMTSLVTGGAGFIGTNLCAALVGQGHRVIALDNLSTSAQNLPRLQELGVDLRVADIADYAAMESHFAGVDLVFHLAAMNRAQRSMEQPVAAHHTNVTGTLYVLEAMRKHRVPKVVFASSSSVYAVRTGPLQEEDPLCPPHPYGVGKLAAEHYVRLYGELFGVRWCTLRLFSVYGPNQLGDIEKAGTVAKYIHLARQGMPLPVYGSGQQQRNFTYVGDVVRGCLLAAERYEAEGHVINIAHPQEVSVLALADLVRQTTESSIEVVYEAALKGDPLRNPANIGKAQRLLGYLAQVSLREGLAKTLVWYDAARKK